MKKDQTQKPSTQKSIVIGTPDAVEGGEEIEVAAQVHVPPEGGWAWVVLAASTLIIFIIDGASMTYGSMIDDIAKSLKIDSSMAALVNAIELAMYFILSPVASALINRFGFRTSAMIGSMFASVGLFAAYFANHFGSLLFFLGVLAGVGDSFINMSASLIIGFYFEKNRSIAMAISTGGSSAGIMAMYPLNTYLVSIAGWKTTILLHAGLHGLIYFLSLTFRPLLSLTVTQTEEEGNPTRTVAYLPTVSGQADGAKAGMKPSTTEKMLGAVSNIHYPTAAAFFQETGKTTTTTGSQEPSTSVKAAGVSRITLQAQGTVNKNQLKQMQSIVSRIQMQDNKGQTRTEITVQAEERPKKSWIRRLFDWEPDSPGARPMYRDDAFYDGNIEKLPAYQKSMAGIKEEARTGLEYQLAVSRAVRVNDLQERRGVCTIAVRRVLASMIDPSLLKKASFILLCLSGLLTYAGIFVPYVFLQNRNLQEGIASSHCALFVSVLSLSNLIGRFIINWVATKVEPVYIYAAGLVISGICTVLSDLSYSLAYQYGYTVLFGAFVSVASSLRSVVIVSLYGLENLTNGTGVMLLFIGIGNLISTPLGGALKEKLGYRVAFYVAGGFIILSGLVAVPIKCLSNRENKNAEKKKQEEQKKAEQKKPEMMENRLPDRTSLQRN